jgi:hypothetical protein
VPTTTALVSPSSSRPSAARPGVGRRPPPSRRTPRPAPAAAAPGHCEQRDADADDARDREHAERRLVGALAVLPSVQLERIAATTAAPVALPIRQIT